MLDANWPPHHHLGNPFPNPVTNVMGENHFEMLQRMEGRYIDHSKTHSTGRQNNNISRPCIRPSNCNSKLTMKKNRDTSKLKVNNDRDTARSNKNSNSSKTNRRAKSGSRSPARDVDPVMSGTLKTQGTMRERASTPEDNTPLQRHPIPPELEDRQSRPPQWVYQQYPWATSMP